MTELSHTNKAIFKALARRLKVLTEETRIAHNLAGLPQEGVTALTAMTRAEAALLELSQ